MTWGEKGRNDEHKKIKYATKRNREKITWHFISGLKVRLMNDRKLKGFNLTGALCAVTKFNLAR